MSESYCRQAVKYNGYLPKQLKDILLTDYEEFNNDTRYVGGWDLMLPAILSGHYVDMNTEGKQLYLVENTKDLPNMIREELCLRDIPDNLLNIYPLFKYTCTLSPKTHDPILRAYIRKAVSMSEKTGANYMLELQEILSAASYSLLLKELSNDARIVSYGPGCYLVRADNPPNCASFNVKEVNENDSVEWFIKTFWSTVQV